MMRRLSVVHALDRVEDGKFDSWSFQPCAEFVLGPKLVIWISHRICEAVSKPRARPAFGPYPPGITAARNEAVADQQQQLAALAHC
jgi:hypothetical protein